MTPSTIYLCERPADPRWELGSAAASTRRVLLIGWSRSVQLTEAGVPPIVSRVISQGLVSAGHVAFLSNATGAHATAACEYQSLAGDSWPMRLGQWLHVTPRSAGWVITRDALTAVTLFDCDAFDWRLKAQVALLVRSPMVLRDLGWRVVRDLLGDAWTDAATNLATVGVEAVLRPGVDGDVAALWTAAPATAVTLRDAMAQAAVQFGAVLEECSEAKLFDLICPRAEP